MKERIETLRHRMSERGMDVYIIPTSDAHNSEYVGEYAQLRRWFTGFTGSNGTLLVTKDEAKLWTDGRYYIQCEQEIAGTGVQMMKMGETGVPTISECIANLAKGKTDIKVGFDGSVMSTYQIKQLIGKCNDTAPDCLVSIECDSDLAGKICEEAGDRAKRSCERVKLLDMGFAGKSCVDKLDEVREALEKASCKQIFISKLDDIMWLFNLRGSDVECNPVALSYAFVSMDDAFIFLQNNAVSEAVRAYLASQRVIIVDYDDVYDFISDYPYEGKILIDEREVSYRAYKCILSGLADDKDIVNMANPTTLLKAIKNETEIKNMREYFLRDSVATTKYVYWLKQRASEMAAKGKKLTELEATEKCDELRRSVEGNLGLSFPTIAAYGANAAMMHYEATKESFSVCESNGMILTDCGGQYPGATTDVTRTVALGPVSDDMIHDYTLVLKGWLALMNAQWLHGCTGRNLDILARGPLWSEGIDYKCGTGHGVGCYLNVHEGPQNIRWKYIADSSEAVLEPGMTVTDEPGVYKEGKYGIRTENTLLVEERMTNSDGSFLGFENLTWVPIDKDLVDTKMLSKSEKDQLKTYQKEVYKRIGKQLTDEERSWLKNNMI